MVIRLSTYGLITVFLAMLVFPCAPAGAEEGLPIPAPGARGVVLPYFSWPSAPVVLYRLYLGLDEASLGWIADVDNTLNGYFHAPGLVPGMTYYWRVDRVLTSGGTAQGQIWSFTTQGLRANDPRPKHGQPHVSETPLLEWTPGLAAYQQDVYLGTDPNAVAWADTGWPEYQITLSGAEGLYQTKSLDPNTTYYWRIDSVELNGTVHPGEVWSFSVWPTFLPGTSELKAWWRCDEGRGQTILDVSGHRQHCFWEDGLWAPGRDGSALVFNGNTSPAQATGDSLPVGNDVFTLTAWLRPRRWAPFQSLIWWGADYPGMANGLYLQDSFLQHTFGEDQYGIDLGPSLGEWIHVAVTHLGEGHRRLFINGTPLVGALEGVFTAPRVAAGPVLIGGLAWPRTDAGFQGNLDDLRVYNKVLRDVEIQIFVNQDTDRARLPVPSDRAVVDIEGVVPLTWTVPADAEAFDIYFGIDRDHVFLAGPRDRGIYAGQTVEARFTPDETLVLGGTYYWRVDSFLADGQIVRGDLWRFSVADYLVEEDFESYGDEFPHMIFLTWRDGLGFDDPVDGFPGNGSGSTVGHFEIPYAESRIVHSGSQSMPFNYNNQEGVGYSETNRIYNTPQDWMRRAVRQLQLYIAGHPDNSLLATDRLYVRLQDRLGRRSIHFCEVAAVLENLQKSEWQLWSIPLVDAIQQGLNIREIKQFSLGIGDPQNPQPGGTGLIYIDDIRLSVD